MTFMYITCGYAIGNVRPRSESGSEVPVEVRWRGLWVWRGGGGQLHGLVGGEAGHGNGGGGERGEMR